MHKLILAALAACGLVAGQQVNCRAADAKPNIVLIMADDKCEYGRPNRLEDR